MGNVEQIKNRLSIVDVVGSYLKLEKAGINYKTRCPFHNEKTPSFFVSPERESYYCFGCGKKGDIFNFVQDFEGVDFLGSLKILADRAGIEIQKVDPRIRDENEKLLGVMEEACSFFERELENNHEALEYLKSRGLKEKTIKEFRLGFVRDEWRSLLEYLKDKNYEEKTILEAGLAKKSEGKIYDRFRSRIIFPINDPSGRVIAFSGRIFGKDDNNTEVAKYINSPETNLFKKSQSLFAYDKAKIEMRKNDFAILVEGNFDALLAHQTGYRNTLAPLGTSITLEQIERISKLTKRIVIAFDSDSAGFKASGRGSKTALSIGVDLKVATMPENLDPADLILKEPEKWKDAIKNSKHIVEFYLEKLKREGSDKRKLGLKVKEEVLPFVVMIENKIDQAHFIKLISENVDIPQESIYAEIDKLGFEKLDAPYIDNQIKKETNKRQNIIRKIIGIIVWQETLKERGIDLEKIQKELIAITNDPKIIESISQDEKENMLFEADIFYEENPNLEKEIEEFLLRLKKDYLEEEFNKKTKELKEAEGVKNHDLSLKILKECQNLSKNINNINIQITNNSN
jgi:DNA primase